MKKRIDWVEREKDLVAKETFKGIQADGKLISDGRSLRLPSRLADAQKRVLPSDRHRPITSFYAPNVQVDFKFRLRQLNRDSINGIKKAEPPLISVSPPPAELQAAVVKPADIGQVLSHLKIDPIQMIVTGLTELISQKVDHFIGQQDIRVVNLEGYLLDLINKNLTLEASNVELATRCELMEEAVNDINGRIKLLHPGSSPAVHAHVPVPVPAVSKPKIVIFGLFRKEHEELYSSYKQVASLRIEESFVKMDVNAHDMFFFMTERCRHADFYAFKNLIPKDKYRMIDNGISTLKREINSFLSKREIK